MPTDRPAPLPGSDYARYADKIVAEKLRLLRLVRALDRAGVDPAKHPRLQNPLVRSAEFDALLSSVLEVIDRDGRESEGLTGAVEPMFRIAEEVRGDVMDALSPDDQDRVRRAIHEVAVSEAEVWMEVEALRKMPKDRVPRGAGRVRMTDAEADEAAKSAFAAARTPRPEGHKRVVAEENRPLPPAEAPVSVWFARWPDVWLETTARLNDVEIDRGDGTLPARIAERLSDAAWISRLLVERLGASERELLAPLLESGAAPYAGMSKRSRAAFEVSWDWQERLPATSGGKLRAFGLVHVGTRSGAKFVEVPPPLLVLLRSALAVVDPEAAKGPERAKRQLLANALEGSDFDDPELERWKEIDEGLFTRFERWVLRDPRGRARGEAAFAAVFGNGPHVNRSDAEQTGLFEFLLFDWRATPTDRTLAEECVAKDRFDSPDEKAVAAATATARPAIYRIGEPRRGVDVPLSPIFPPGPDVRVTDRMLSLTVESGWVMGVRVYAAGPYFFVRLLGDAVAPEREKRLLRALDREKKEYVRSGGDDDPAEFVRARPAALIRALRGQRD